MERNIQLIIPMSGIGKRFIDEGYKDPKPLIEIDGYPMIKHVVDLFPEIEDISFICNEKHLKETNMVNILKEISPNCKIYEVPLENRKGPVDAVLKIVDEINDESEIIISYCDYGTTWDFQSFLKFSKKFDGVIPSYKGFHPHMLGSDNYAFCKEENLNLIEIKEKEPFTDNKMNEFASNGTYYFKSGKLVKKYFQKLIDLDINVKGEFYVSMVYNLMIKDNLNVGIFEIEKMLQWGTPYDLEIYKNWSNYFNNKKVGLKTINNPKGTTLILPMAGKGSRFSDIGYNLPKPLLEVDEKPMVVQAVKCLPQSDNNIFICLKEHLDNYNLENELKYNFDNVKIKSINYVTQGQACTCEIGINEFKIDPEAPILISACDNGVYYDTEEYQKLLDDESIDIIVWTFRNNQSSKNNPNMYAWLDVDDEGFIKYVSCKKFIFDDPLKTHAIIGTMFFRKCKYFSNGLEKNYIDKITTNGEYYVDDVLNQNIKSGLKVKVFEVKNYICWGTPDDYKTYNYWNEHFNSPEYHQYSKFY